MFIELRISPLKIFKRNTYCSKLVSNNSMVAKPGKFQIMFLGSSISDNNITFTVENKLIKSTNKVKRLRITVDQKLTFTKHINNLCNTASNRLISKI